MIFFYILIGVMPLDKHPLWSHALGGLTLVKYLGGACLLADPSRRLGMGLADCWRVGRQYDLSDLRIFVPKGVGRLRRIPITAGDGVRQQSPVRTGQP
jgi:hypothetical protein